MSGVVCRDGMRFHISRATDESDGYVSNRDRALITLTAANGQALTADCSWDQLYQIMREYVTAKWTTFPRDGWQGKIAHTVDARGQQIRLALPDGFVAASLDHEDAAALAEAITKALPKEPRPSLPSQDEPG